MILRRETMSQNRLLIPSIVPESCSYYGMSPRMWLCALRSLFVKSPDSAGTVIERLLKLR